jgi:leucyl-tRNA synthetase
LPTWDDALAAVEEATLVVQVNGKVRDRIAVSADIGEEEAKWVALESANVLVYTQGKEPAKVIYIPGRYMVSIVV